MSSYLEITKLNIKYQQTNILKDISFKLNAGESISILGRSGCGKSTLFQAILGAIIIDEGTIENTFKNIAYMPQNDILLPWRTVIDNLMLPFEIYNQFQTKYSETKHSKKTERKRCQEWLEQFNLGHILLYYPHQLSGGMQKRVALLRAFLTATHGSSGLLLLDEPFAALDNFTRKDIHSFMLNLIKQHPLTLLMITHDINEALLLSDKVIVFEQNKKGTSIRNTLNIELPKPRSQDILLSEQGVLYQKILAE